VSNFTDQSYWHPPVSSHIGVKGGLKIIFHDVAHKSEPGVPQDILRPLSCASQLISGIHVQTSPMEQALDKTDKRHSDSKINSRII
jgi:hypothetical protein